MQLKQHHINLKWPLIVMVLLVLINVSLAASYNSGKTKKKNNTKSALSFHVHNKSLHLSASNGFLFKGSTNMIKNQKNGTLINLNSMYFQKGNNIYVVPLKQQAVIFNKFRAPQKSLF